jgi:hypothetical protein
MRRKYVEFYPINKSSAAIKRGRPVHGIENGVSISKPCYFTYRSTLIAILDRYIIHR